MACRDDGQAEYEADLRRKNQETTIKDQKKRLDELTSLLCLVCAYITEMHDVPLPSKLTEWYEGHKEWDKKRLEKAKVRALAKLNDEEREALGL